jgi:serine/threonine protein kinase
VDPRPPRSAGDIFDEVLDLAPEARDAFLERACAGDARLRAEVDSLLAALPSARRFFEASPVHAAAGEWLADLHGLTPGATLGPYRLLEPIASGGMGAVYLAERTDEAYRQRVAIKFLRPGLGGPKMLERFRTERQVLADLQHPGIAHLVDGGTAPGGLPYLVMEYVDGEPIDRYCRELPVERRLALFLDVCDAVQYAHAHLVVHRDLKPGNIFVDRGGRVRLLEPIASGGMGAV